MNMDLFVAVIVFLSSSQFVCCSESFLRFVPVQDVKTRSSVYSVVGGVNEVVLDAYTPHQVLIKIMSQINFKHPQITFHCTVAQLDPSSKISKASFCWRKKLDSGVPECHSVMKTDAKSFGDVHFSYSFDELTGYKIWTEWDNLFRQSDKVLSSVDGFYYCELSNENGDIRSNYIEVQNIYFYKLRMVKERQNNPKAEELPYLNATSFPLTLYCGKQQRAVNSYSDETWTKSIESPFQWHFCPFGGRSEMSLFDCYQLVSSTSSAAKGVGLFMDHIVKSDGTLILVGRTEHKWEKMGLICVSTMYPGIIYSTYFGRVESGNKGEPLIYDEAVPYTLTTIEPISSREERVRFRAGVQQPADQQRGDGAESRLFAMYRANPNPGQVNSEWTKDGGRSLPKGIQSKQTRYSLTFPEPVLVEHAGTYTLTVTQRSPGQDSMDFIFHVTVDAPPKVKNPQKIRSVEYRMVGESITLVRDFEGPHTQKSLEINGMTLNLLTDEDRRATTRNIESSYPYLRELQFSLDPVVPSPNSPLTYKVDNLRFLPGAARGQSHTVTFKGSNSVGEITVSTLIKVLKPPTVLDAPIDYNCTNQCVNTMDHKFRCQLDTSDYVREGLVVHKYWEFDKMNLEELNSATYAAPNYFSIFNNDTLVLRPVLTADKKRDKEMQQLLLDNWVTCRLRLYHPDAASLLPNKRDEYLVYDSATTALVERLKAKVSLVVDPAAYVVATSSFSWIAAVIIAIVIILAIALLAACVLMRNQGETYLVDQKERAQGNDPIKEIRDKEAFQTYERAEEAPLHGSRFSLNDNESVGVGTDDERELEEYELDPGKFNEEGSFIGQYAADPRKKQPTLPPAPPPLPVNQMSENHV